MRLRSPASLTVIAIVATWATAVVLHAGHATGEWLLMIRQTVTLLALAGLLGLLAATVDNLVDDLRFGTGGKGGGGPMALRARITKPATRGRPRRGGPSRR